MHANARRSAEESGLGCAVTTATSLVFAKLRQQGQDSSGRAHRCGQLCGCRPPRRGWSCQAPPMYQGFSTMQERSTSHR
eukprot:scaffold27705_cov75-Phaeocystis_antarctica.AAC.1